MLIIKAASRTLQHYHFVHKVTRLSRPSELNLSVSRIYLKLLRLKLIHLYTWGTGTILVPGTFPVPGTGTVLIPGTRTVPVPLTLVLFHSVLT